MEPRLDKPLTVMYIRHAQSQFNLWYSWKTDRLSAADKEKYATDIAQIAKVESKFDPQAADPPLSLRGREQLLAIGAQYQSAPVKFVFVSPLRRTLDTCRAIFDAHPCRKEIRFFVHPLIREALNNANDIPGEIDHAKAEFGEAYDFDTYFKQFKEPRLHFLYTLNSPDRETLLKEVEGRGTDYRSAVTEAQKRKLASNPPHHRKLETYKNLRERAVQFAGFLRGFIKEKGLRAEEVAVVSHCNMIGYSQATVFNENGKAAFKSVPNCSYALIDIEKVGASAAPEN